VKKGLSTFGSSSYTLSETRGALKDTAQWSTSARR
jgi:hypothetical protein